jgi:uncharacterized protein YutE (UPF0331/DUF86 family)
MDKERKMKRFRNILIHRYGIINDRKVFIVLSKTGDFDAFMEEIKKFLKNAKR